MKYLPYLENHNLIFGLIGKETISNISESIKVNARKISQITGIPVEEIRFNNYTNNSEYKIKIVRICTILLEHCQKNGNSIKTSD
mgnify:CR=1 FL=1